MNKFFILCALCAIGESSFAQVFTAGSDTKTASEFDSVNGITNHSASNNAGLGAGASASLGAWSAQNGSVTAASSGESSSTTDSITYGINSAVYNYSLQASSNLVTSFSSQNFSARSEADTKDSFTFNLTASTSVSEYFNLSYTGSGDLYGSAYADGFSFSIVNSSNSTVSSYSKYGASYNGTYSNSVTLAAGTYTVLASTYTIDNFSVSGGFAEENVTGTSTANESFSLGFATPAPEPCSMMLAIGAVGVLVKRRLKKD